MISVRFQGKPFNITVIQVYAPTSNDEEAEVEWFYEDLQDLLFIFPALSICFWIKTAAELSFLRNFNDTFIFLKVLNEHRLSLFTEQV